MERSAEARKVLRELDSELASASTRTGTTPDPRLKAGIDPDQLEARMRAAVLMAPKYSPTVLYQPEALLAYKAVRIPRWMLRGKTACLGWAPYRDGKHESFTIGRRTPTRGSTSQT